MYHESLILKINKPDTGTTLPQLFENLIFAQIDKVVLAIKSLIRVNFGFQFTDYQPLIISNNSQHISYVLFRNKY